MADETWWTVGEIAALVKVREATVREWLRTEKLRGRNFGGKTGWRVKESDLNVFLEADRGKAAA